MSEPRPNQVFLNSVEYVFDDPNLLYASQANGMDRLPSTIQELEASAALVVPEQLSEAGYTAFKTSRTTFLDRLVTPTGHWLSIADGHLHRGNDVHVNYEFYVPSYGQPAEVTDLINRAGRDMVAIIGNFGLLGCQPFEVSITTGSEPEPETKATFKTEDVTALALPGYLETAKIAGIL